MKLFNYDSSDSVMEKVVETIVPIGVVLLLLFMNLSGLGIFRNCYSQSCSHAGFVWKVIGLGLSAYACYFFWRAATDRAKLQMDDGVRMIFVFVLFALSFAAYSGFNWWFNVCQ